MIDPHTIARKLVDRTISEQLPMWAQGIGLQTDDPRYPAFCEAVARAVPAAMRAVIAASWADTHRNRPSKMREAYLEFMRRCNSAADALMDVEEFSRRLPIAPPLTVEWPPPTEVTRVGPGGEPSPCGSIPTQQLPPLWHPDSEIGRQRALAARAQEFADQCKKVDLGGPTEDRDFRALALALVTAYQAATGRSGQDMDLCRQDLESLVRNVHAFVDKMVNLLRRELRQAGKTSKVINRLNPPKLPKKLSSNLRTRSIELSKARSK
jgi:hypothetical protein